MSKDAAENWIARFCNLVALPTQLLQPHVREHRDLSAAKHLLRLAAGLESLVLGEDHVLGQVRGAYLAAQESGSAGPLLSKLFQTAIHTGKRVRTETRIGQMARSYAQVALEKSPEAFATGPKRVLILGSGTLAFEMSEKLASLGHSLTVISRHEARGRELADRFGAYRLGFDHIADVLAETDVIVACTASPRFVIEPAMLRRVRRPISIIDFGLPRNIDPQVARNPFVRLVCLEQLTDGNGLCAEVLKSAETIVFAELRRFERWLHARRFASQIARLRSTAKHPDRPAALRVKRAVHVRIRDLLEEEAA